MQRSASGTSRGKTAQQIAGVAAFVALFVLSMWVGDELWSPSAYWPAGAAGFGVTLGLLLPLTFRAAKRSFRRCRTAGGGYSVREVATGLAYGSLATLSALAVSRTIPAKSSTSSCHSEWQPCWVDHVYPGAFLGTLGGLVAAGLIMYWRPRWWPRWRAKLRRWQRR